MMPLSEETIFDLYKSLALWKNRDCNDCRSRTEGLSGPVSIWQVGEDFKNDPYRLVFIGKTARGTVREPDEVKPELNRDGYIDATREADNWIREERAAYWNYTAAILQRLFGALDVGWRRIAFTNLVKCNASMGADTTPAAISENCIDKLGVVWHELEVLQPRHVILYTGHDYDEHLARYTAGLDVSDVTDRQHFVKNGAKKMLWWERQYLSKGKLCFRLLRTSHPERQYKEGFVNNLVRWVKEWQDSSHKRR